MGDRAFIDALLAKPLLCRFALVRGSGEPFIRPMWYLWEEGRFTMTTPAGTQLTRLLENDQAISLCIDTPTPPYQGVVCDGVAEVQGSLGRDLGMLRRIAERYLPHERVEGFMEGPLAQVSDRRRVVVHPRRWTIWNMDVASKIPIRAGEYR